ncbi:Histidyl-tRNA synthetase [Spraguea lophii 42_110]|uniref:histidine--tRNA ligase n=1 Tax=Spraguea lophii (strain 42_110) TaxID=1358809 RepID=S7W7G6_SPRLO|nr:Histidyl-tRNA synthetase [Spraguea lophii 42_110]
MLDIRTPKGTVDYGPLEAYIIDYILNTCTSIFKTHGAISLDTPTFELRDILLNKFGDDEVQIYNLEDQGGDICSLRYDLTVGFSRYLAQTKLKKIKRYQMGKVFRRDQPAITKGRYREFYQCDYDIAGDYLPMVADAEIIQTATAILEKMNLGEFILKINSRKILLGFAQIIDVDQNKINSAIDKLAKIGWDNVQKELIEKGVEKEKTEILKNFIEIKTPTIENLKENKYLKELRNNAMANEGIEDLMLLEKYLKIYNIKNYIFDFSLARGANYYTGMIFEGFYDNYDCGAVVAGGRYDNLVEDFLSNPNMRVPCVGFSVGVMRIFSIINNNKNINYNITKVYISSSKQLFLEDRLSLLNELWNNNINAETYYNKRINIMEHKKYCKKNDIPIMIVIGEEEIKNNEIDVLLVEEDINEKVKREDMIKYIKEKVDKKKKIL